MRVVRDFWADLLQNASACPFPCRHRDKAIEADRQNHLFHTVPCTIDGGNRPGLQNAILAAWALILPSHANSHNVVLGACLEHPSLVVPLRISPERDQAIGDFLGNLSGSIRQLSIHSANLRLEEISTIGENIRRAGLFQTVIDIHRIGRQTEQSEENDDNLVLRHQPGYVMQIDCQEVQGNFSLSAAFDANLISAWRMQHLLHELGHVVGQLLALKPGKTVNDIEVVSPQERTQMLSWNQIPLKSENVCVHETIMAWAESQPQAEALCSWDGSFTYAELDDFSTKVAQYLIRMGIGSQKMLPLCIERSALAIVVILGVLRAGYAFIPLEAANPIDRNRKIVLQSGAEIVLVSKEQLPKWSGEATSINWGLIRN